MSKTTEINLESAWWFIDQAAKAVEAATAYRNKDKHSAALRNLVQALLYARRARKELFP